MDPAARLLSADGTPVPLGSTAFSLLLTLVEHDGAFVPKDDLMSRVWGHADVGDNRLHVHINALRKIVGRDCIVTKQGGGYRFAAEIERQAQPTLRQIAEPQSGNLLSLWTSHAAGGPARLIGRSDELRAISELLARKRLVTLSGPGGVGKTSLALHAARENSMRFPHGVWLVELAALNDPDLVAGAVATALGVKVGQRAAPIDALARQLSRKSLLLVLDNCEHVIAACAHISESLLAAASNVKILATSREALSCSGEQVFEVSPLAFPRETGTPTEAMREIAAVELFMERAMSAGSKFRMDDDDVSSAARICRRVDGLPLAIEMVAGWAGVLGLKALDAEFEGPAQAWLRAGSTAPSRHATLRATLEWSHNLLSPDEQIVLRRLAVFADGFTMQAAKTVVGDERIPQAQVFEHIGSLIRKSMLASVPGTQRYRLLETTRAFMLERLAVADEAEELRQRHARHVLQTLERAMDEWETTSDAVWLERHGAMLHDLRAALDWAVGRDSDDAVALAGASWPLWQELSLRVEGRQRLSFATQRLRATTPPALEARLRNGLGWLCLNTGAITAAHEELARAAMLFASVGEFAQRGGTLAALGFALLTLDRIVEAEQTITEALSLLQPTRFLRRLVTAHLANMWVEFRLGHLDTARSAGEKAARLCEAVGADRAHLVVAINLTEMSLETGDFDNAVSAARELAARLRNTFHSGLLGYVLGILAAALTARGNLDDALAAARQAAPLQRDEDTLFWLFDHLAFRRALAGHVRDAAVISGYSDAAYRSFGRSREPVGRHAVERLRPLLCASLPDDEVVQLKLVGERLTEDQAIALALRE